MLRPARVLLFLASAALAVLSVASLATNPLVLPLAQLGATEARLNLERAMARRVDARWLLPRLEAAVAAGDVDRAAMLLSLAVEHRVTVPDDLRDAATALVEPGFLEASGRCAACAYDVALCRSVAQIVACALPVELTPLGDVNALRRQGMIWVQGEEVDRLETGLALVGLGATGFVVVSGGSSAAVKAGVASIRVMRLSDRMTPRFSAFLTDAADIPVTWSRVDDYVRGRAPLSDVTDVARLARLRSIADDAGRLYRNTSATDTFALMRHVDAPDDLARLARLSDSAGPLTRPAVETLGLARALRATIRLADWAIALSGLLMGIVTYLAGLLAAKALGMLRRRLPRASVA